MLAKEIEWGFIIDQIYRKNCAPILSNNIAFNSLFDTGRAENESMLGDDPYKKAVFAWAKANRIEKLVSEDDNVSHVAQIISANLNDPVETKYDYLDFLKGWFLYVTIAESGGYNDFLEQVERELRELSLSPLVTSRLHFANFNEKPNHPLRLLATLDFPVYITTSHHHFLRSALETAGKSPRTRVYPWREDLRERGAEFTLAPDSEPVSHSPLIYHLHGIEDYEDSMVLTEDDHLEFLVEVKSDLHRTDVIPRKVRTTLSSSSLLLLGFDLQTLESRVFLHGLLKDKVHRPRGLTFQHVRPQSEEMRRTIETYIYRFFGTGSLKLDVFWGDFQEFMEMLWQNYQGD